MSLEQAIAARRSVRSFTRQALPLGSAAQLLWAAQGITDAKRGFRAAPSAGALYPLRAVLVAGDITGLKPGAYEYLPEAHALKLLVAGDLRPALCTAALGQAPVLAAPAVVCLLGDYAITHKKYGPRAERYVHLEAGHAGQNICLQAVALGLGAVTMGAFDDAAVRTALGVGDALTPLYLIPVGFASK
jgi:SagB-type dehydrogenase family enzyme